jgi:hypothetical protein
MHPAAQLSARSYRSRRRVGTAAGSCSRGPPWRRRIPPRGNQLRSPPPPPPPPRGPPGPRGPPPPPRARGPVRGRRPHHLAGRKPNEMARPAPTHVVAAASSAAPRPCRAAPTDTAHAERARYGAAGGATDTCGWLVGAQAPGASDRGNAASTTGRRGRLVARCAGPRPSLVAAPQR